MTINIHNMPPVLSTQKGNDIYISDLSNLYQNAIQKMRYNESNWIANCGVGSTSYTKFALHQRTKRIIVIMTTVGTTKSADVLGVIKTLLVSKDFDDYTLDITTAFNNKSLTLTQKCGHITPIILDPVGYQTVNGGYIGEYDTRYTCYIIADFTKDEMDNLIQLTDGDGVPINNKIIVSLVNSDSKSVIPNKTYIKFIEIGSGIDDEFKTFFYDGQVIPKKMLQGFNKIKAWELKDYTESSKNETYNNFILTPTLQTSNIEIYNVQTIDETNGKKFCEMWNNNFEATYFGIATNQMLIPSIHKLGRTNKTIIQSKFKIFDGRKSQESYIMTSNDINIVSNNVYLNNFRIHRLFQNQNLTDKSVLKFISDDDYTTNEFYSTTLQFQNRYLNYDAENDINTNDESILLFNFIGDLTSNTTKIPINNIMLSYMCKTLSLPFYNTTQIVCEMTKDANIIKNYIRDLSGFTFECYSESNSNANIIEENFNDDGSHNVYIKIEHNF